MNQSSDSSTTLIPQCRVAVCDDVADFRELLVAVLENAAGFDVVGEAANGAEAIEVAARVRPDVLLLDIAMPVMDGLEALPRIREVAPTTRVIVFTGFASAGMRSRATGAGAVAFIEKGLHPSGILTAIRSAAKGPPFAE